MERCAAEPFPEPQRRFLAFVLEGDAHEAAKNKIGFPFPLETGSVVMQVLERNLRDVCMC